MLEGALGGGTVGGTGQVVAPMAQVVRGELLPGLVLLAHCLLLNCCGGAAGVKAWQLATILDGRPSWRLLVGEGGSVRISPDTLIVSELGP